jgi:hypothetical protein
MPVHIEIAINAVKVMTRKKDVPPWQYYTANKMLTHSWQMCDQIPCYSVLIWTRQGPGRLRINICRCNTWMRSKCHMIQNLNHLCLMTSWEGVLTWTYWREKYLLFHKHGYGPFALQGANWIWPVERGSVVEGT